MAKVLAPGGHEMGAAGAVGEARRAHRVRRGNQFSGIANLLHFGMIIVGLPYSFGEQRTLDEIVGGSPYGASTIAGGKGERQPSEKDLAGARYQGQRVAQIAEQLFRG